MVKRRTKADVAAWGVVGVLVGAAVLPLVAQENRARELSNRSACASNLHVLMQSMLVYGAENSDLYPYLPSKSNTTYDPSAKGEWSGGKKWEEAVKEMYKGGAYGNNPYAQLWLLVLNGQIQPKAFVCKSDPFAGEATVMQKEKGGVYRMNFDSPKAVSYSVAYMWGSKDAAGMVQPLMNWKNTSDSSLPIVSDMAPYLSSKAAAGEAMTRPAGRAVSTTAPADPMVLDDGSVNSPALQNSPNHLFDGQNVGFADGHVEFMRRTDIGPQNDNIFRQTVTPENRIRDEQAVLAGALPGGPIRDRSPFDTVMVPTRSAKGELK